MASEETRIQQQIQIDCSKHAALFRTPAGLFWQGRVVETPQGKILVDIRPVKVVVPGYSDLTGFRRSDGKFIAIEVKTKTGRPTKEQLNFIRQVKKSGGCAGIARSPEEALKIILEGHNE